MKSITITFAVDEDKLDEFWKVIGNALAIDGVFKEIEAQYLPQKKIEDDCPF
jgi:hypothetical protein